MKAVLSCLLILTLACHIAVADLTDGQKSMKGIRRVGLAIVMDPAVSAYSDITERDIRALMRQSLSGAGLTVLSAAQVKREKGQPQVSVEVVAGLNDHRFAFSRIVFSQEVTLSRSGLKMIRPTFVSTPGISFTDGNISKSHMRDLMLENLSGEMDDFLKLYRGANPRR